MRIEFNRTPEQVECSDDPPLGRRLCKGSKVEIVGSEIACRSVYRSTDLGSLQRRFDYTRYTACYFVLKLEYVF